MERRITSWSRLSKDSRLVLLLLSTTHRLDRRTLGKPHSTILKMLLQNSRFHYLFVAKSGRNCPTFHEPKTFLVPQNMLRTSSSIYTLTSCTTPFLFFTNRISCPAIDKCLRRHQAPTITWMPSFCQYSLLFVLVPRRLSHWMGNQRLSLDRITTKSH